MCFSKSSDFNVWFGILQKGTKRKKAQTGDIKARKADPPDSLKVTLRLPSQKPSKAKHAADPPNSSKAPTRNALEKRVQKRKREVISALEDGHLEEEQMEEPLIEAPQNRRKKAKSASAIIPESLREEKGERKVIVAKASLRKRARDIKDDTPEELGLDIKANDSPQGLRVPKRGAKRSKQAVEKDLDLEDQHANVSKLFSAILQVYAVQSMYSESTRSQRSCSVAIEISLT